MKSALRGVNTSNVEIGNIGSHALWVLVADREYCIPYEKFPWFREATIAQLLNVQLLHGEHLYWPDIDVDLSLSIINAPERFPLIAGHTPE